jgi:WD40 repeat protein
VAGGIESIVEIRGLSTGDLQAKSIVPGDGMDHHEVSRPSANGKHVVFWNSLWAPPNTPLAEACDVRFALIDRAKGAMDWVGRLKGRFGADDTIRTVVPSDDGRYIAVAGWDTRVAILDVAQKKVLWVGKSEDEAYAAYVAFAPDNKLVYAGGTEGAVYGMEVKTGKIVSKWFASETGKEEYGHRISTISVSPDGRFVAAGTGPEGKVFVFSTKKGKLVKLLDHGGSTILITSFSPDSKRLGSVAAGRIKIWRMPEDDAPSTEKTDPRTDKHHTNK